MSETPGLSLEGASALEACQSALFSDLPSGGDYLAEKPLLAHYTSIEVLEKIVRDGELWFSNPLFMNDHEEVRFGILQGTDSVRRSDLLASALGTPSRVARFRSALDWQFETFANGHVLDTYVFSLSQHDPEDSDGLLSMWRGYGANGNGAAIVFDTGKLTLVPESPLLIGKVNYLTTPERLSWIAGMIDRVARVSLLSPIPDEFIHHVAELMFHRLKFFSLFTKHRGFNEEREWRVVYFPDRDIHNSLGDMFSYHIGPRGIEPKLKFKLAPIMGITALDISLTTLVERIILGPTVASVAAQAMVKRVLTLCGHADLADRLQASTIPYRNL